MTTSECIDYKALIECNNNYWVGIESQKMYFLAWILDHPEDAHIIALRNAIDGKSGYKIDTQAEALWQMVTKYNPMCSHTNEHCYKFVVDMVILATQRNKFYREQAIKNKITKLEKELQELKQKLAE